MTDQLPTIRPTQFESGFGVAGAKSVNMFTGCVGLTESLVNLAGPKNDSGLGVTVQAVYSGNVQLQANNWNLDGPTSTLGLGWCIPRERIVATTSGSVSAGAFSYALDSNNVLTSLIADSVSWTRLVLSSGNLAAGTVAASVVAEFAGAGIILDPSAQVSDASASEIQITDAVWQRIFLVNTTDGTVTNGGISFQAHNYDFRRIFYYPEFEHWEIYCTDGQICSYGGIAADAQLPFNTSIGNSIEWGVCWKGGDAGSGSWTGPCNVVGTLQQQYARGWNIASRRGRTGASVTYLYNNFPRDNSLLIGCGVEQFVGASGGLTYTKACYLSEITDAFGRNVTFSYEPKWFKDGYQEYLDPHKDLTVVDPVSPNAYQDCYETLYLDSIQVLAQDQSTLMSIAFDYSVVDVSSPALGAAGVKRLLTQITEVNAYGQALPPCTFTYEQTPAAPNVGAMISAQTPEGAVTTWIYAPRSQNVCDRQQIVDAPGGLAGPCQPYAWFGADYVVVLWVDTTLRNAMISVYTWAGRWVVSPLEQYVFQGQAQEKILVNTLAFQPNDNTFALGFATQTPDAKFSHFILGGRDPNYPAQWTVSDVSEQVTGDLAEITGGTNFVVATFADSAATPANYPLVCWTWAWQTKTWSSSTSKNASQPWAIGQNEYYLVMTGQEGTDLNVTLNWLDTIGDWQTGWSIPLGSESLKLNESKSPQWGIGPSTAAITFAAGSSVGAPFNVWLLNWSADYQTVWTSTFDSLQPEPADEINALRPPPPQIGADGFFGVRQYLFRLNGNTWTPGKFAAKAGQAGWLLYSYGADIAIQAASTDEQVTTSVIAFDPDIGDFKDVSTVNGSLAVNSIYDGWPATNGGDFLVASNNVYFRGFNSDWSSASSIAQIPLFEAQSNALSANLVNQAPNFIAYQSTNGDSGSPEVVSLTLQNGQASGGASLDKETFSSNEFSIPPSGPSAFVSWPQNYTSFQSAQSFSINRYAAQAVVGPIEACPVTQVDINDGFGNLRSTAYQFDASTAACDVSGNLTKYYTSLAFPGCSDPADAANGVELFQYVNGQGDAATNILTDGLILTKASFSAVRLFVIVASASFVPPDNTAPAPVSASLISIFRRSDVSLPAQAVIWKSLVGAFPSWVVSVPDSGATYTILPDIDVSNSGGYAVYQGRLNSSVTNGWQIFSNRWDNDSDASLIPLHGGYPRPVTTTTVQDGVMRQTSFDYVPDGMQAPLTGARVTTQTSFLGPDQTTHTYIETSTALAEVLPEAVRQNLIKPQVANQRQMSIGQNTLTTGSSATVWAPASVDEQSGLTVLLPTHHWAWSGDPSGQDDGVFPFGEQPSVFWRSFGNLETVSLTGIASEITDVTGVRNALLLDAIQLNEVARMRNGSFALGQGCFTSFECYEDVSSWLLDGVPLSQSQGWELPNGYSSAQCLALAPGGTLTGPALNPDPARALGFWVWVQTETGYTGGAGAGFSLTLSADKIPVGSPTFISFPCTFGLWQRIFASVDLPALCANVTGEITLAISAVNPVAASGAVMIDTLAALPVLIDFGGRTLDPVTMLPIAEFNAVGLSKQTGVSNYSKQTISIDQLGSVVSLKIPYLSLQGNPQSFSPSDPNAQITISATGGGTCETFYDGQGWTNRWTADVAGAFAAAGGMLVHASTTTSNTLTSVAPSGDFALFSELVACDPGAALTDSFSVSVGDVTFTMSTDGAWTVLSKGVVVPSTGTSVTPLTNWLIIQLNGQLTLIANGQTVFSAPLLATGGITITTGTNAIGFRNLSLLIGPVVSIDYTDATGNQVQSQNWTAEGYWSHQTVYDSCGLPLIQTKIAPSLFGSGEALPMPAFRSGFVNVADFVEGLDGAAVMSGDVADWYNGQNDASDDQGYPYQRVIREPSGQGRPVEFGFPGKDQAIINAGSTSPESRATTQHQYGMNPSVVPYLKLPADDAGAFAYSVEHIIAPSKDIAGSVADASGRMFGRYATAVDGTNALSTCVKGFLNGQSQFTRVDPSTYESSDARIGYQSTTDALLKPQFDVSNDAGTCQYLYAPGGHIRLYLSPAGVVTYYVWDALGRELEEGIVSVAWDPVALQAALTDPMWPSNQTEYPVTPLRRWTWDGAGTPEAIGHLTTTWAFTPATLGGDGPFVVAEAMTYAATGLLASRSVTVTQAATVVAEYTFAYQYDALGRMVGITYPDIDGIALKGVSYKYDGLGRVIAIVDQDGQSVASFNYDSMGRLVTSLLPGQVTSDYSYDSCSRLLQQTVGGGSSLSFTTQLSYSVDGLIVGLEEVLTSPSANFQASVTYSYDGLKRVVQATDAYAARNLSVSYAAPYGQDLNGDIQQVVLSDGTELNYTYPASSSQLTNVTLKEGVATTYKYANGLLTSQDGPNPITINYLGGWILPTAISTASDNLSFGYDSRGERIVKQTKSGTCINIYDGAGKPLLSQDVSGAVTLWIPGPWGTASAIANSAGVQAIIFDYLGSSRLVCDPDGNVTQAYAYDAQGRSVYAFNNTDSVVPFRYTGHELDAETGIYSFKSRLYAPYIGRFLAPDPAEEFPSGYCYAAGRPTSITDPDGALSQEAELYLNIALGIVIAAATAGAATVEVATVAQGVRTGLLIDSINSGAASGLVYDKETDNFTWGGFAQAFAAGAIAGGFAGGLGRGSSQASKAFFNEARAETSDPLFWSRDYQAVSDGDYAEMINVHSTTYITTGGGVRGIGGRLLYNIFSNYGRVTLQNSLTKELLDGFDGSGWSFSLEFPTLKQAWLALGVGALSTVSESAIGANFRLRLKVQIRGGVSLPVKAVGGLAVVGYGALPAIWGATAYQDSKDMRQAN